jgi:hypothetical protein
MNRSPCSSPATGGTTARSSDAFGGDPDGCPAASPPCFSGPAPALWPPPGGQSAALPLSGTREFPAPNGPPLLSFEGSDPLALLEGNGFALNLNPL